MIILFHFRLVTLEMNLGKTNAHHVHEFRIWGRVNDFPSQFLSLEVPRHSKYAKKKQKHFKHIFWGSSGFVNFEHGECWEYVYHTFGIFGICVNFETLKL